MDRQKFLTIIKQVDEFEKYFNDVCHVTHADLFNGPSYNIAYSWLDTLLEETFTEEGADYINSYLFDNLYDEEHSLELYDENGELVVSIHDPEGLWNFVQGCRK